MPVTRKTIEPLTEERKKLAEEYAWLPDHVIRKIKNKGPNTSDRLHDEATLELIACASMFDFSYFNGDPDHDKAIFTDFAKQRIRWAVIDAIKADNAIFRGKKKTVQFSQIEDKTNGVCDPLYFDEEDNLIETVEHFARKLPTPLQKKVFVAMFSAPQGVTRKGLAEHLEADIRWTSTTISRVIIDLRKQFNQYSVSRQPRKPRDKP